MLLRKAINIVCKINVIVIIISLYSISYSNTFELPPLPYPENELEPVISSKTVAFHYGKHHKGYVDNLNKLIKGTEWEKSSIEKIIMSTSGKPENVSIFNNAAQVWNHNFYWQSLRSAKEKKIPDTLKKLIENSFGSIDSFSKAFIDSAIAQFGSGYAWLVKDSDKLKIVKTANADNPMTAGLTPLLTLDVWEHAYYLDHQNKRVDYVTMLVKNMLNWDFALKNLKVK